MNIITQDYTKLIEEIIKKNFNENFKLENSNSFSEISNNITTSLGKIFRESLVQAIENLDEVFFNSDKRRKEFYTKAYASRTLTTIFGDITFKRYSYVKKEGGKSFFYIDQLFKFVKYDKYDPLIKAWLMNEKASSTFQKSGDIVSKKINDMYGCNVYISRQQVFSIFKKLELNKLSNDYSELNTIDKIQNADTLYIMLDEKYIHLQKISSDKEDKNNIMMKHCVLYTGIEKTADSRHSLKNKVVFSSISDTLSFVQEVETYIDSKFEKDSIKNIVISGDGAKWIKYFSDTISVPKSNTKIFILDAFHLGQSLIRITKDEENIKLLRSSILEDKKDDFNELVISIMENNSDNLKIVKQNVEYILNQWESIQNQKNKLSIGCCMEGQISHNLAKHFTRDPKGYAQCNLEKHMLLRDAFINKVDIVKLVLNQYELLNSNNTSKSIFNDNFTQIQA